VVIKSLRKQLDHVIDQPTLKHAQMQDEQHVQPMGNELVNAPNMEVAERIEFNNQHQITIK
jgi:hypothetical protein